jgi:heptosyltransferase-2
VNVDTVKAVDKYIGACCAYVLGLFKRKQSFSRPKRILFIQLWGIGETVCTLPAVLQTARKFPKASIEVLVTARSRPVYEGFDAIKAIHEIRLNLLSIVGFVFRHTNDFDLMIDLEEYLNTSANIGFFVGKYRVGYADQARSRLYDKTASYNDRQHVVNTFLDLPELVGVRGTVQRLPRLPSNAKTMGMVRKLFKLYSIPAKSLLVGMGTGAAESSRSRKWPAERFAEFADKIITAHNATVVFFGSEEEANDIDSIGSLMHNKAVNLAGKTNVRQLFAVMAKMDLFIGNDSGPMHIAAAQGVKTIGLFGPNLPQRFGPFGPSNAAIHKAGSCEFSPCINVHKGETPDCLYPHDSEDYQKCMKAISVDEVMRKVERVMS